MTTERPFGLKRGRPDPGFTFTGEIADFRGTGPEQFYFHFHRADKDSSLYPPTRQSVVMPRDVNLQDESDRWRYVCPRGHRSWEPTNNHFWCRNCARQSGADAEFSELHDCRDDEQLDREEVRLLTPAGPYKNTTGGTV